jgi:glycosyltransferase involved in cell wall biosynthesis
MIFAIINFSADNGTERMASSLLSDLATDKDIFLLSASNKGEFYQGIRNKLAKEYNLRDLKKRGAFYINALKIWQLLLAYRPETLLVFNYQWGLAAGLALNFLPSWLQPKHCVLIHHISVQAVTSAQELARMKLYFPLFTTHVVPSSALRDELGDTVGNIAKTSIKTIHNGLDIERIIRLSQEPCLITKQTVPWVCIYVGGLREDKKVDRLIRYFSLLPENNDTLLILLGDGEERSKLEGLAKTLGVAEQCLFMGHVQNPYPYIKHADVLVQTSDWETFGLSFLEAMVLKTTVLAMEGYSSGLLDVVQHQKNAMVIGHKDEKTFVKTWSSLLRNDALRKTLETAGYEHALKFSLAKMSASYRELLS